MNRKQTIINADKSNSSSSIFELLAYKGLYKYLFIQIAKQKFRETILGVYWIALRPLLPALITIFVFTRIASFDSSLEYPYPLFYFSGYLFWSIFASCVAFLPRGLRMNRGFMKRVYFPRVIIPLASIAIPISEFIVILLAFTVVFSFFIFTGQFDIQFTLSTTLLPFLFILALVNGISLGMFLGALSLIARDILFLIPYIVQILLISTPLIYPIEKLPFILRLITLLLNPMSSIIIISRDIILKGFSNFPFLLILPTLTTFIVFIFSYRMFNRAEAIFMEEI